MKEENGGFKGILKQKVKIVLVLVPVVRKPLVFLSGKLIPFKFYCLMTVSQVAFMGYLHS